MLLWLCVSSWLLALSAKIIGILWGYNQNNSPTENIIFMFECVSDELLIKSILNWFGFTSWMKGVKVNVYEKLVVFAEDFILNSFLECYSDVNEEDALPDCMWH